MTSFPTTQPDYVSSDHAFDLTGEDEAAFAMLIAAEENVASPFSRMPPSLPPLPPLPPPGIGVMTRNSFAAPPQPPPPRFEFDDFTSYAAGTTTVASSPRLASTLVPQASGAVDDILDAIADDDLDFDPSELDGPSGTEESNRDRAPSLALPSVDRIAGRRGEGRAGGETGAAGLYTSISRPANRPDERLDNRSEKPQLPPSVGWQHHDPQLASFVAQTRPRSAPMAVLPQQRDAGEEPGPENHNPDNSPSAGSTHSPLLRFRTFPRKPFSVSDLTAGQWCELQYFYTLAHLPGGKKTRTEAMKQGTHVHKKLERQIFRPVKVKVTKKEDAFGLRLWNIIQGLRTLRDTGITRELEVWGVIEGNIVCGVIDLLTHKNPDPELQDDVLSGQTTSSGKDQSQSQLKSPQKQKHITDFFLSSQNTADGGDNDGSNHQHVYITDVKTRATATQVPRTVLRGTILQLFLYHRMLSVMACDQLDYDVVFRRYSMQPDETFSDEFLAQMSVLYDELFFDARTSVSVGTSVPFNREDRGDDDDDDDDRPLQQQSLRQQSPDLLKYASLRALLVLLKDELRRTFPRGADTIGQIVAVEYRYRGRGLRAAVAAAANAEVAAEGAGGGAVLLAQDEALATERGGVGGGGGHRRRSSRRSSTISSTISSNSSSSAGDKDEVIHTRTFFVDPNVLDNCLQEDLEWWRGERPPRGVPLAEAFKCGHCEFAEACEWRRDMEADVLRKVKARQEREATAREERTERARVALQKMRGTDVG